MSENLVLISLVDAKVGGFTVKLEQKGVILIRHRRPRNTINKLDENFHLLRSMGTDADLKVAAEGTNIAYSSLGCRNCRIPATGDGFRPAKLPYASTILTESEVNIKIECQYRRNRRPSAACFDSIPAEILQTAPIIDDDVIPF